MALGACDTSKPANAAGAAGAAGASVIAAAGPQPAIACPSKDLNAFVAAFAEDPALQKAFTAETIDTAFVDMNAQPEPAESVEALPRDKLRFPVMPNRAQQQKEGLKYREVANEGGRAVVVLEIPDTDAQLLYTFRRDVCWTLVKIVDPAFGSAFPGEGSASDAPRASAPTPVNDGCDASKELSNVLTAWLVSTKDHLKADPVAVRGWAIGLKVAGLTPTQLRSNLTHRHQCHQQ